MLRRTAIILLIAGCGVLVATGFGQWPLAAIVAKLTASTGFFLLALVSGACRSAYGNRVLAGLLASWIGDACLLGTTDSAFIAGLGAFLIAHLFYCAAFVRHGVHRPAGSLALLMLLPVTAIVIGALWPDIPGPMRLPVAFYGGVISLMVALAVGARFAGGTWLIPVGAVLFFISDLSVAIAQFQRPDFPPGTWGLPLYFTGQALLAASTREQVHAAST